MRIALLIIVFSFFQQVYAQSLEMEYYSRQIFSSGFDKSEEMNYWPAINNSEVLSIVRNGKYLIQQKSTYRANHTFPEWTNPYPDYEISSSIALKSGVSVGICFEFDENKNTGYIFEINDKQRFRLKKMLPNGDFSYPQAKNEKKSWNKFSIIAKNALPNDINILIKGNDLDIYINGFFTHSYRIDRKINCYNVGLFTAPASSLEVDYFKILVNDKDYEDYIKGAVSSSNEDKDMSTADAKAVDIIFSLRKKSEALETENEDLKLLLEKCKEDNVNLDLYIKENLDSDLQEKLEKLKNENFNLKSENQALKEENKVLEEFKKNQAAQGDDKDLVDFLYEELNKEQLKNATLQQKIEKLEQQLKKK